MLLLSNPVFRLRHAYVGRHKVARPPLAARAYAFLVSDAGSASKVELVIDVVGRPLCSLVNDVKATAAAAMVLVLLNVRLVTSDLEEIAHGRVHHNLQILENLIVDELL